MLVVCTCRRRHAGNRNPDGKCDSRFGPIIANRYFALLAYFVILPRHHARRRIARCTRQLLLASCRFEQGGHKSLEHYLLRSDRTRTTECHTCAHRPMSNFSGAGASRKAFATINRRGLPKATVDQSTPETAASWRVLPWREERGSCQAAASSAETWIRESPPG